MSAVRSFAPIADPSARLLVLGSMPGVASLQTGQYYAHPRNAFWPIMGQLFGFDAAAPYPVRVESLKAAGVAVWDVLQACVRPGSLDSAIETGSRVPNDFPAFFAAHPDIACVAFNGAEAEKSFNRLVLPGLGAHAFRLVRLPSSSPAHAVSLAAKTDAWGRIIRGQ
ncbi:DNA-deoxyinosine glycosylase [Marinihelvus fidelis]|uniref:DNA-deoxyinosine glycosylase n=1 Tax=Marinihelvus fidelis TaxID=2613842 RepID=A0A5N0T471_9GAMM|nr:DNA-deoxyinosine glycosylase [Marinihelvus fidelis]KAA9129651.1 DNA-deoxyinosine glycosylase [Marinihelvus fidelis]